MLNRSTISDVANISLGPFLRQGQLGKSVLAQAEDDDGDWVDLPDDNLGQFAVASRMDVDSGVAVVGMSAKQGG